jgi:hypothetical protein
MQADRAEINPPPLHFACDPLAREFPPEWKDVYFRQRAVVDMDGVPRYECPLCNQRFDHRDIDFLQGDHIWPYSVFGDTTWGNYQLICGRCNASKRNYIGRELRVILGQGEFRRMLVEYLRTMVANGRLAEHHLPRDLLNSVFGGRH